MDKILGIRIGHDAAAALVMGGRIIADVAEERFTRAKNDGSFPINAIGYCLSQGGISSEDLDALALPSTHIPREFFYFFPSLHPEPPSLSRLASLKQRFLGRSPTPTQSSSSPLPLYIEPFPLPPHCRLVTMPHHLAHAASAYYTSGLGGEKALVVTMDGLGNGLSNAIWRGENGLLTPLRQWNNDSSLGWFYSAVTEALGWRHGSDEWKTMGLAPYGQPMPGAMTGFHPRFENGELVQTHDFGNASRWLDHGANHYHLQDALPLRKILQGMTRESFAAEAQRVVEEEAMAIILPWLEREGTRHLCAAGGFFLNVKFNQKLWYTGQLDNQWIYPNPGDGGLAVGAALHTHHAAHPGLPVERLDSLYLGPSFKDDEILAILKERKLAYEHHPDIARVTAAHLAENRIVGWFQGRMESGPRALGNRSILMSPLHREHKDRINACVKYREAFRPFCPSLLHEKLDSYLLNGREESFMITSFQVQPDKADKIPAVVHVDGSLRPQTVRREVNPLYHHLIRHFGELTGEYVLLNTSFNVKGEPIVCHPREAIRCFFDTGLDILVIGHYLIKKPNMT